MRAFATYIAELAALVVFLLPSQASSQQLSASQSFTVSTFFGGAWKGSTTVPFTPLLLSRQRAAIQPGPAFGLGLRYGPLVSMTGTDVSMAVEFAFAREGGSGRQEDDSYEVTLQRIPIFLWLNAIATTELSPFLRIGFGAINTSIRETASGQGRDYTGVTFDHWDYAWGLGTGLSYMLGTGHRLDLFWDCWLSGARIEQDGRDLGKVPIVNVVGGRFIIPI